MNSGQKVMIFEATKVTPVVLSAYIGTGKESVPSTLYETCLTVELDLYKDFTISHGLKQSLRNISYSYAYERRFRIQFNPLCTQYLHLRQADYQVLMYRLGHFLLLQHAPFLLPISTLQMFTGHYGVFAGFPCCQETL